MLLIMVLSLFLCSGCGPLTEYGKSREESPAKVVGDKREKPETTSVEQKDSQQARPASGAKGDPSSRQSRQATNQELLDSALDLVQGSNDFWEQGDLESAIDALDKAYALILSVETDDDSDLMQQKEDLRIAISKRIVEVYASRFTVADGSHKAIPLIMNDYVRRELESFKGRERDFFLAAYRRSGKYRPAIQKALKEAGLPKELSWLPLIESGYKVRALSRARALGLWQFIASTGYKYGLKRDTWIDERMDTEKSTRAAIDYLKELHQMFGDWTTALAAYNCGEWGVLNRIKTQRINYLDNFWDLYEKLPRETASYVPRFLAVLHILNNPGAYGMDLPPVDEEIKVDEVTINKKVQLKTIASRLDIDYDLLQELNAELRQDLTPDSPYPLKVPYGKGDVLLAKLSDIPESDIPSWRPYSPSPPYVVHNVKKGESLATIAQKYKTSVKAIKEMNGLGKAEQVKVGWTLKVPTKKGFVPVVASKTSQAESKPKLKTVEYVVRPGDNLWKVAHRYNTSAKELKALNKLESMNVREGQVLLVPSGQTASKAAPTPKTKSYKVKEGDYPALIAKKHDMEISDFLKLNNLTPKSTIRPGQAVKVVEK
jgi:membrane-bound lytic murein transglycosylase D